MATVDEMLTAMSDDLDYPDPQHPSPGQKLLKIRDALQYVHNLRQNTQMAWSIDYWDLQAVANTGDYLVSAGNFGKDIFSHTVDDTDTSHRQREIKRCNLDDIDQNYQGPKTDVSGLVHSAQFFSFYRRGDAIYLRVTPIPTQSATYRIWFKTGKAADLDRATVPAMPEHHPLIRVRASFFCAPFARWSDVNKHEWPAKRQELQKSLVLQIQDYERTYKIAITSDRQEGPANRRLWGDAYEPSGGEGWW